MRTSTGPRFRQSLNQYVPEADKTDWGMGHLTGHVSEQPALARHATYCTSTTLGTEPVEDSQVL